MVIAKGKAVFSLCLATLLCPSTSLSLRYNPNTATVWVDRAVKRTAPPAIEASPY